MFNKCLMSSYYKRFLVVGRKFQIFYTDYFDCGRQIPNHQYNAQRHFQLAASINHLQKQQYIYTASINNVRILHNHNPNQLINNTALSQICRSYSHSKDKPKHKKAVVINEHEMAEVMDVELFKSLMNETLEEMKDEFLKQLTVRGAAGALETLEIEFDGDTYPLQELAQIGRKNPQLVVLNLSSLPDACQPVIKAIQESGMNLNPQQEGTTIYVPLPKVTREHREFLAKNAKVIFVKYKTQFQSIQNKFVKQVKNTKGISEDLSFNVVQQIMKLTENIVTEAEKLVALKQKELLDSNK